MKNKNDTKHIECETSSGNVFADLGLSNPEERLAKADLAIQIDFLMRRKKLSQKKAAKLLDIDQTTMADLHNGVLMDFTLDRLIKFLNILGQDVVISVAARKRSKPAPRISVNLQRIKPSPSRNTEAGHSAVLAKKKR